MSVNPITINGFELRPLQQAFTAYVADMPDSRELRRLRESLGRSWFVYWYSGKVFGLPKEANAEPPFGLPQTLNCKEHLRLLAAAVADFLPTLFPQYTPIRKRPFTFLGQKDEIIEAVCKGFTDAPSLVRHFKIRPKYELHVRIIEPVTGKPFLALLLSVSTRWEILAPIGELQRAGIDLRGLYVVRRKPSAGERRLLGKIERVSGDTILLEESFDDRRSANTDDVYIEGSRRSFARCLRHLLGRRHREFEEKRQQAEGHLLNGPSLDKTVETLGDYLSNSSPFSLTTELRIAVGGRVVIKNEGNFRSILQVPPVEYCFDPARSKRHRYAWNGIEKYGPFSRDVFPKKSPNLLVVFPENVQGAAEKFLRYFRDGINNLQNSRYGSGFTRAFGLVNPRFMMCPVRSTNGAGQPSARDYRSCIEEYLTRQSHIPDAAILVLLDEDARRNGKHNPYLQTKATLLMAGIPVQEIRMSTLNQRPYALQYILQNIAVAVYAKMSGTPWTVDHDLTINDELVIGIGTCELLKSRFARRQRFIGVTTVFRGDGNYLLGNVSKECSFEEYPDVLKNSTIEVLREIKERNGWRNGDTVRIVFHAYKPLRRFEMARIIADCVRLVGKEQNIEFAFLTVSMDHPFRALDKLQKGIEPRYGSGKRKGVYVPERGTIIQVGQYTRLLCINGPNLLKRPGSPIPTPLLVHLLPESTFKDITYLSEQVLKFTALSWRSLLPAQKPVTIYYSELIANLLARLRAIPDWSPAMLNVKLRASRWFL